LERTLSSEPLVIIDQLKELITETVELVELHMPAINTEKVRQQLVKRQQEWKPT
jgi:hypothetical protein